MKNLNQQPSTHGSNKIVSKNPIIRPTFDHKLYKPSDSSSSGIVSARTQSAPLPPGQAVTHTLEQGGAADYPVAAAADTGAEVDQSTGFKNEASPATELNVTQAEKGDEGSEPPVTAMAIEFHPLSALLPPLTPEEQDDLTEDIRNNGLIVPIVSYEEKILDGRGRYLGCLTADVSPRFRTYDGNDPVGYLVSCNVLRRHLTGTQRAMIGAEIAKLKIGANQHSEGASIETASKSLGVSVTSINRSKKVIQDGTAELVEVTRSGKLALSKAVQISRLSKEEQAEFLAHLPTDRSRGKSKQSQRSEENGQASPSSGDAAAGEKVEESSDRDSLGQEISSSITAAASHSSEANIYPDLPPELGRRLPSGYEQVCAELTAAWRKEAQALYDVAPRAVQRWFVIDVLGAHWMGTP
jgi:hypothetical protein